jgi:hypothetical protein
MTIRFYAWTDSGWKLLGVQYAADAYLLTPECDQADLVTYEYDDRLTSAQVGQILKDNYLPAIQAQLTQQLIFLGVDPAQKIGPDDTVAIRYAMKLSA